MFSVGSFTAQINVRAPVSSRRRHKRVRLGLARIFPDENRDHIAREIGLHVLTPAARAMQVHPDMAWFGALKNSPGEFFRADFFAQSAQACLD